MNDAALSYSTVYNGFKNNDYQGGSVTVSGSIAVGATFSSSVTIALERDESVAQIYLTSNRTSAYGGYTVGDTIALPNPLNYFDGTTASFPLDSAYGVVFLVKFELTQVTITVFIQNPYAEDLSNIDAIYNFEVYTFVAPFIAS